MKPQAKSQEKRQMSFMSTNFPYAPNKRMQTDRSKRYALSAAADAGRYEVQATRH